MLLLNAASGAAVFLDYPDAAIWDLITRGNPSERAAAKLCPIASLTLDESRALVDARVARWRSAGFLAPEETGG